MEGDLSKNPFQKSFPKHHSLLNAWNSGKWSQKEGRICPQYEDRSGLSNQLRQATARNRFSPGL
jgi:hypothetical protein